MENLNMYCLTLEPNHKDFINQLGYHPVGLGNQKFDDNWLTDKSGESISHKNKNYGEYTFHYWIWKNYMDKLDDKWIGFCQYRKFFSLKKYKNDDISFKSIKEQVLKKIPKEIESFDSILVEPMFVNQLRPMKFLKSALKLFMKRPSLIYKNNRNLSFHFNWMHGDGNLDKAINFLDLSNKHDFKNFVQNEVSFNPHNMFICKSKKILNSYYEDLFPWLEKCEKIFGFDDLKGYGKARIYGFLAERFLSYWFKKNTNFTTMPLIFYDIRKDLNKN